MNYCPHCNQLFFNDIALAEHRKACKVWAGEKKPEPKKEEEPKTVPDWFF